MCTRCTPFAYFSGINIGFFTPHIDEILFNKTYHTHTRLDMAYLCDLYEQLIGTPSIIKHLTYYPNNSLYKLNNQLRYVEYHFDDYGSPYHELISIDDNIVLEKILLLTKSGLSYSEIKDIILSFGYDKRESEEYLVSLIENQVLISNLFPSISGIEYQHRLLSEIEKLFPKMYGEIDKRISNITSSNKNIIWKVKRIKEILSSLNVNFRKNHLLQVDLRKDTINCNIKSQLRETIEEAVKVVSTLSEKRQYSNLEKFKMDFYERYEEEPVSLIKALDSDIGIDYRHPLSKLNSNRLSENDNRIFSFKLRLFTNALKHKNTQINITDEDLKSFDNHGSVPLDLPPSYSFIGSVYYDKISNMTVCFKSASGPSAINLIARFGHSDKNIETLCRDLVKIEEKKYSNVIFAEIVHLPHGRIGNVITRPHFREYEIPYLTFSTLPLDKQITVDDLYIRMDHFKLILFSKKHKKEVIPRLSNAHNFEYKSLPIYQFLCDLQFQHYTPNIHWSWGSLSSADFLPRITYKNTVLSLARWNLQTTLFNDNNVRNNLEHFHKLIKHFNLPDYFVICQGDNVLYINIHSILSVKTFLSFCRKYDTLMIEEFPYTSNNVPDGYVNELIVPLSNSKSKTYVGLNEFSPCLFDKKTYSPLSKCIFFKIYTGTKYLDKIIIELLPRLVNKLKINGLIEKWFFIRYSDPHDHLRLRFFLSNYESREMLLVFVKEYFNKLMVNGTIWDIKICTYRPERDRYGSTTFKESEQWFAYNSETVIKLLGILNGLKIGEQLSYLSYCVDNILEQFGYDLQDKLIFVKTQLALFTHEFALDANKELRSKLNADFRRHHDELVRIMEMDVSNLEQNNILEVRRICKYDGEIARKIIKTIKKKNNKEKTASITASFIHMFANRFFTDRQRYWEMNIYFRLSKYYTSCFARMRNSVNK